MSYRVEQNSVITLIGGGTLPSKTQFLTCGGTNIAPKTGQVWADFLVGGTKFKYIFNNGEFNTSTKPKVTGYDDEATAPTTIKQSLYNNGTIQYICGQFTAFASAQNVAWFNPTVSSTTDAMFYTLSDISFTGTNNAVNCMSSDLNGTFSKIFLAGRFDTADIDTPTTWKNMVCLDVSTVFAYTIDTGFTTTGTLLDSDTVTINSMIVVKKILYVAGTDGTDCIFYSYNGSTWTNLLGSITPITGNINVLQAIGITRIAIGGKFTSIGSATNCNNIVIFTISNIVSNASFTSLGTGGTKGVTNVAATSPIYANAEVFALSYLGTNLWVGGYFLNAGGTLSNSIAIYSGSSWITVKRNNTTVGLLLASNQGVVSTNPGVVYALSSATIDTSIVMVGGSFETTTNAVPNTKIYNLVKITNPTTTSATQRTYSVFNETSNKPKA
jgi:hypothetical protein